MNVCCQSYRWIDCLLLIIQVMCCLSAISDLVSCHKPSSHTTLSLIEYGFQGSYFIKPNLLSRHRETNYCIPKFVPPPFAIRVLVLIIVWNSGPGCLLPFDDHLNQWLLYVLHRLEPDRLIECQSYWDNGCCYMLENT